MKKLQKITKYFNKNRIVRDCLRAKKAKEAPTENKLQKQYDRIKKKKYKYKKDDKKTRRKLKTEEIMKKNLRLLGLTKTFKIAGSVNEY